MIITDDWLASEEKRYKNQKNWVYYISLGIVSVGLVIAATLGAVTFAELFGCSLLVTSLVFASGIVCDFQLFIDKLPKMLHAWFVRNPFADLEASELLGALRKIPDAKEVIAKDKGEKFLDTWLHLRKRYHREAQVKGKTKLSPKALDQGFLDELKQAELADSGKRKDFLAYALVLQHQLLMKPPSKTTTLGVKKGLVIGGIFFAAVTGLGFGCIAFGKWASLLGFLGVISASAVLPIGWVIAGGVLAGLAGLIWAVAMYRTVYNAIKNNLFKQLFNDLKIDFSIFKEKGQTGKKILTVLKAIVKYSVTAVLAGLGLVAVGASVGAYGSAMLQWLTYIPTVAIFIAALVILPVRIIFALRHAAEAVSDISELCKKALGKLSDPIGLAKKVWHWFKNDFLKHPLKMISIAIVGSFLMVMTVLHVVAEAALQMGGSSDNTFFAKLLAACHISYAKAAEIVSKIAGFFKLTSQQLMVVIQSSLEFLEHFNFTFTQTPQLVEYYESTYKKCVGKMNVGGKAKASQNPAEKLDVASDAPANEASPSAAHDGVKERPSLGDSGPSSTLPLVESQDPAEQAAQRYRCFPPLTPMTELSMPLIEDMDMDRRSLPK